MKAARLHAFGQPLVLEDVPDPVPGADDVLVQTHVCGIDGTDLKLLDGFGYTPELPFVMGHEIAGVVADVGRNVSDVHAGDRVIVYNFLVCGHCPYCLTYREQLCVNMRGVVGVLKAPGGYGEFVRVPARQVVCLPDHVAWADGAICCDAGLTAFHALDRSQARIGETVVIIGIGGVGAVLTQLARRAGLHVVAVDHAAEREAWALENGAHEFLDSTRVNVADAVRERTHGLGADCVIDVVGKETTLRDGVNALRRGGRLVVVGYTPDLYPISGKQLAQNELELIGTRAGRRQDLRACVELVADGAIQSIVRYQYPLEQANVALDHLRSGTALGRIVLTLK